MEELLVAQGELWSAAIKVLEDAHNHVSLGIKVGMFSEITGYDALVTLATAHRELMKTIVQGTVDDGRYIRANGWST